MHFPLWVLTYVLDPLERAGRTFAQQFAVILLATSTGGLLITQNWLIALDSAAFAALVSILTSVLTFKVPRLTPALDLTLRVLKTFLQSFLGTITASAVLDLSHVDWQAAVAIALPVAFTAFLTGLAAFGKAGSAGASLIPLGRTVAIGGADDIAVLPDEIETLEPDDDEQFEPFELPEDLPDEDEVDPERR